MVSLINSILWAAAGTGFTLLMTVLGSATVFIFRKNSSEKIQRIMLGFAAGVMIAASVWSLIIPAVERARELGGFGWLEAAGGFMLGIAFLVIMDRVMTRERTAYRRGRHRLEIAGKRSFLLVAAVTLHNIPEGMAVGLSFAMSEGSATEWMTYASAAALALGIGIQNFPEGAAISLPLKQEGMVSGKAFLYGALSGVVEPIFGILTVLVAALALPLMPWLLSFAAGAMMYVVVEELIPECGGDDSKSGTLGAMTGFVLMMVLDIALG